MVYAGSEDGPHHGVVQRAPDAAALERRVHEERPDVRAHQVRDRKPDDAAVDFRDPAEPASG